jgi:hypothetical protein
LGLLAGFAVPLLGTLAAAGLVLYFLGALIAHLRVGSRQLVGWAVFFSIAAAALAVDLASHLVIRGRERPAGRRAGRPAGRREPAYATDGCGIRPSCVSSDTWS